MKCITLQQPWAGLILAGGKDVENRSWSTSHRGPLLIHAGRSIDSAAWQFPQVRRHAAPELCHEMGVILGVVELYDVRAGEQCQLPWASGTQWVWLLRKPQIFRRPILYRGAHHLFHVVDAQVRPAINNAMTPAAWRLWRDQQRHAEAAPSHQPSLGGWTGD